MSRATSRAGFGPVRGSLNPQITIGTTPPANPKLNHLWLDTTASPATWKYWDGTAWQT